MENNLVSCHYLFNKWLVVIVLMLVGSLTVSVGSVSELKLVLKLAFDQVFFCGVFFKMFILIVFLLN
jgi:hypothetical protein